MTQARDRLWATAKVTDSQSYGNGTGLSWVYAIEGAERFYNVVSGKPLPLAVGESIHISPDGTKLHIIDGSGKEPKLLISKQSLRSELAHGPTPKAQPPASVPPPAPAQHQRVSITIKSTPAGADIQLNGRNVGRTPTTTDVDPGRMDIMLRLESSSPWVITDDVGAGGGNSRQRSDGCTSCVPRVQFEVVARDNVPVVVYKVDPAYTQAARDEHISGAVTLIVS